ncbi:MAG TPA: phosphoheptose isomerase [Gammaproteobacteria bacterium]|uniref:D-sedoheptulose-7-phosphate isomerase n=1 Tax=Immundisolibacter sp. TaxID=1934948 RepID=UPI000E8B64EC|nr:phosphoheptose isomerase [Gammaproteobacteria bacterium]HCZ49747.1 phosphoheptose isomerase [Gammaproteobacteria bacterium]MCH79185.1 phosphoheptose isomerase [Gammaproteobacteria bacterium]
MNSITLVIDRFDESARLKQATAGVLAPAIARAASRLAQVLRSGGKLLVCGNGGSAADAQHFSGELLGRFECERAGLPAIALHADTSTLTAVANDYGYDDVFARQVQALARPDDALVVISTSGNSPGILRAAEAAQALGVPVLALTGRDGGRLAGLLGDADIELRVPATATPRIQEVHILILHCLCELIDRELVP